MKSIIKTGVTVLTAVLLACTAAYAQPSKGDGRGNANQKPDRDEWYQKIKAQKIAFFTSEIGLTEAEAKSFWPIYDAAETAQREASHRVMEAYRNLMKAVRDDVKDDEVEKLLDAYVNALEASKTVDPDVIAQYEKVLPAKKVAKIFIAEEKFRQQQIRQLHSQGGQPGGPRGGQPGGFQGGQPGSSRGGQPGGSHGDFNGGDGASHGYNQDW